MRTTQGQQKRKASCAPPNSAGASNLVIEGVNQPAGAIVNQLRFHDLPYVSINLLQLLSGGLGENCLYPPLEYPGVGFVMVERE